MGYSNAYLLQREQWAGWQIEARELMRLARVSRGARACSKLAAEAAAYSGFCGCAAPTRVGVDSFDGALRLARDRSSALAHPMSIAQVPESGLLPFGYAVFDAILGQLSWSISKTSKRRCASGASPKDGRAPSRSLLRTPTFRPLPLCRRRPRAHLFCRGAVCGR